MSCKTYLKSADKYGGWAIWEVQEDGLLLCKSKSVDGFWWEWMPWSDLYSWSYDETRKAEQSWDILTYDDVFLEIL